MRGKHEKLRPGQFMKKTLFSAGIAALLISQIAIGADQEPTKEQPKAKPVLTQEQLEAKFKATLTEATMSGRWCSVSKGKLGPEKEDKYTIVSVSKLNGDSWIIRARIQYGKVDMVAPVPVKVKWAGDTPVIVVDNLSLGEASYSARILVYDQTYAGTWSGGDHGGLMNGVITNNKKSEE
jgi:hypothetical protein